MVVVVVYSHIHPSMHLHVCHPPTNHGVHIGVRSLPRMYPNTTLPPILNTLHPTKASSRLSLDEKANLSGGGFISANTIINVAVDQFLSQSLILHHRKLQSITFELGIEVGMQSSPHSFQNYQISILGCGS